MKEAKGLRKIFGLMFRSKETEPLEFKFDKDVWHDIHSIFVFFNFLIVWFDKDDKLISWHIVEPFTYSIKPPKPYRRFIEIPFTDENQGLMKEIIGEIKLE